MTVCKAIGSGLCAASRAKFLVFIFFACNLLVAAMVAAPMHQAIASHLGNSKTSEELVRGFSSAWLAEFQIASEGFPHGFSLAVMYAGLAFLLLNTILSGGAFEVFVRGEGAGMHAFGRGLGRFFARFVRLALVASVLYFVAFWFWNGPVAGWISGAYRNSVFERGEFWLHLLRTVLLLFTVLVVNAVVEYAKAAMVTHQHRSAIAALGRSLGFVLRHFRRVMAIYIGVGLFAVAAILLYATFARYFPQNSTVTILIWFVVAQVLLWFRWMFRLASWGATVAFYGSHVAVLKAQPEVEPVAETPVSSL